MVGLVFSRRRPIHLIAPFIAGTLLIGIVGYRVAGLGWLDAVYQTLTTFTTVGFQDLSPRTGGARVFTIVMVATGVVALAFFFSLVTASVVENQLRYRGRRRLESKLRELANHIIICGGGRFGRAIAAELLRKKVPFALIELDPARAAAAREEGLLVVEGDATEEAVLETAGIFRARALLTTLESDASNVYVTLTAKQMSPDLHVVSIGLDERAARKLKAAGAGEVVSPYVLGGSWMAQIASSPTVADFIRLATGANPVDFYMDEQKIAAGSPLAGVQLRESPIRSRFGVIVVAVRRATGEMLTNPPGEIVLGPGDVLVSLGQHEKLAELRTLAAGKH
jgi:voltage-gated potassium channel